MDKIKSSKFAVFLNTCGNISNLAFTKGYKINTDGNNVSSTTNIYASDFFRVESGATIAIVVKSSGFASENSNSIIAYYNSSKEKIEVHALKSDRKTVAGADIEYFVVPENVENADKIRYCRFSAYMSNPDIDVKVVNWNRIGKGVTSMPISYGAKTTTETYVDEDNASTSIDSYEIASDIEQTAVKGEPMFDFVDYIRKNLLTGSDCETDALIIPIYDFTQNGSILSGTAQKFGATIAITDLTVKGGETIKIKYKLSFNGDPKNVDIELENGKIKPSEEIGTASFGGEIIDTDNEVEGEE